MEIKVSETTNEQLDWLVADIEGERNWDPARGWWESPKYTTNWSQGGPIIEREINVLEKRDGYWYSWRAKRNDGYVTSSFDTIPNSREAWADGKTPLIAAMRCYVVSKLGETVDIPKELL